MVVPVTQEQTSVALVLACRGHGPVYELGTVLIVRLAVALEAKVYVCEYQGLAE